MSSEFATPLADLGESVMRVMRNATAAFNGGAAVDCIFRNRSVVAGVGVPGVYARQTVVTCLASEVEDVLKDHAVEIDSAAAPAVYYIVRQREPDDLHTGLALFVLEPKT